MADLTQQLQEQVLQARAQGQKLNIVGGGTKVFLGRAADPGSRHPEPSRTHRHR